ncbi:hypothetical protein MPTK1_5g01570 [Marchantia polymorpha subsp. ruderalis]|uniref:Uncharacterized protein n=2 Tax=Marchantia polymorpha TaxID=3197 RepID=A0AAF6BDU4_MARPO|nr:hypothetical protein Mp_5g01570 [Marchantia polymorpha subsp. ruderalis]
MQASSDNSVDSHAASAPSSWSGSERKRRLPPGLAFAAVRSWIATWKMRILKMVICFRSSAGTWSRSPSHRFEVSDSYWEDPQPSLSQILGYADQSTSTIPVESQPPESPASPRSPKSPTSPSPPTAQAGVVSKKSADPKIHCDNSPPEAKPSSPLQSICEVAAVPDAKKPLAEKRVRRFKVFRGFVPEDSSKSAPKPRPKRSKKSAPSKERVSCLPCLRKPVPKVDFEQINRLLREKRARDRANAFLAWRKDEFERAKRLAIRCRTSLGLFRIRDLDEDHSQGLDALAWAPPEAMLFTFDHSSFDFIASCYAKRPRLFSNMQKPLLEDETLWRNSLRAYHKSYRTPYGRPSSGHTLSKETFKLSAAEEEGHFLPTRDEGSAAEVSPRMRKFDSMLLDDDRLSRQEPSFEHDSEYAPMKLPNRPQQKTAGTGKFDGHEFKQWKSHEEVFTENREVEHRQAPTQAVQGRLGDSGNKVADGPGSQASDQPWYLENRGSDHFFNSRRHGPDYNWYRQSEAPQSPRQEYNDLQMKRPALPVSPRRSDALSQNVFDISSRKPDLQRMPNPASRRKTSPFNSKSLGGPRRSQSSERRAAAVRDGLRRERPLQVPAHRRGTKKADMVPIVAQGRKQGASPRRTKKTSSNLHKQEKVHSSKSPDCEDFQLQSERSPRKLPDEDKVMPYDLDSIAAQLKDEGHVFSEPIIVMNVNSSIMLPIISSGFGDGGGRAHFNTEESVSRQNGDFASVLQDDRKTEEKETQPPEKNSLQSDAITQDHTVSDVMAPITSTDELTRSEADDDATSSSSSENDPHVSSHSNLDVEQGGRLQTSTLQTDINTQDPIIPNVILPVTGTDSLIGSKASDESTPSRADTTPEGESFYSSRNSSEFGTNEIPSSSDLTSSSFNTASSQLEEDHTHSSDDTDRGRSLIDPRLQDLENSASEVSVESVSNSSSNLQAWVKSIADTSQQYTEERREPASSHVSPPEGETHPRSREESSKLRTPDQQPQSTARKPLMIDEAIQVKLEPGEEFDDQHQTSSETPTPGSPAQRPSMKDEGTQFSAKAAVEKGETPDQYLRPLARLSLNDNGIPFSKPGLYQVLEPPENTSGGRIIATSLTRPVVVAEGLSQESASVKNPVSPSSAQSMETIPSRGRLESLDDSPLKFPGRGRSSRAPSIIHDDREGFDKERNPKHIKIHSFLRSMSTRSTSVELNNLILQELMSRNPTIQGGHTFGDQSDSEDLSPSFETSYPATSSSMEQHSEYDHDNALERPASEESRQIFETQSTLESSSSLRGGETPDSFHTLETPSTEASEGSSTKTPLDTFANSSEDSFGPKSDVSKRGDEVSGHSSEVLHAEISLSTNLETSARRHSTEESQTPVVLHPGKIENLSLEDPSTPVTTSVSARPVEGTAQPISSGLDSQSSPQTERTSTDPATESGSSPIEDQSKSPKHIKIHSFLHSMASRSRSVELDNLLLGKISQSSTDEETPRAREGSLLKPSSVNSITGEEIINPASPQTSDQVVEQRVERNPTGEPSEKSPSKSITHDANHPPGLEDPDSMSRAESQEMLPDSEQSVADYQSKNPKHIKIHSFLHSMAARSRSVELENLIVGSGGQDTGGDSSTVEEPKIDEGSLLNPSSLITAKDSKKPEPSFVRERIESSSAESRVEASSVLTQPDPPPLESSDADDQSKGPRPIKIHSFLHSMATRSRSVELDNLILLGKLANYSGEDSSAPEEPRSRQGSRLNPVNTRSSSSISNSISFDPTMISEKAGSDVTGPITESRINNPRSELSASLDTKHGTAAQVVEDQSHSPQTVHLPSSSQTLASKPTSVEAEHSSVFNIDLSGEPIFQKESRSREVSTTTAGNETNSSVGTDVGKSYPPTYGSEKTVEKVEGRGVDEISPRKSSSSLSLTKSEGDHIVRRSVVDENGRRPSHIKIHSFLHSMASRSRSVELDNLLSARLKEDHRSESSSDIPEDVRTRQGSLLNPSSSRASSVISLNSSDPASETNKDSLVAEITEPNLDRSVVLPSRSGSSSQVSVNSLVSNAVTTAGPAAERHLAEAPPITLVPSSSRSSTNTSQNSLQPNEETTSGPTPDRLLTEDPPTSFDGLVMDSPSSHLSSQNKPVSDPKTTSASLNQEIKKPSFDNSAPRKSSSVASNNPEVQPDPTYDALQDQSRNPNHIKIHSFLHSMASRSRSVELDNLILLGRLNTDTAGESSTSHEEIRNRGGSLLNPSSSRSASTIAIDKASIDPNHKSVQNSEGERSGGEHARTHEGSSGLENPKLLDRLGTDSAGRSLITPEERRISDGSALIPSNSRSASTVTTDTGPLDRTHNLAKESEHEQPSGNDARTREESSDTLLLSPSASSISMDRANHEVQASPGGVSTSDQGRNREGNVFAPSLSHSASSISLDMARQNPTQALFQVSQGKLSTDEETRPREGSALYPTTSRSASTPSLDIGNRGPENRPAEGSPNESLRSRGSSILVDNPSSSSSTSPQTRSQSTTRASTSNDPSEDQSKGPKHIKIHSFLHSMAARSRSVELDKLIMAGVNWDSPGVTQSLQPSAPTSPTPQIQNHQGETSSSTSAPSENAVESNSSGWMPKWKIDRFADFPPAPLSRVSRNDGEEPPPSTPSRGPPSTPPDQVEFLEAFWGKKASGSLPLDDMDAPADFQSLPTNQIQKNNDDQR